MNLGYFKLGVNSFGQSTSLRLGQLMLPSISVQVPNLAIFSRATLASPGKKKLDKKIFPNSWSVWQTLDLQQRSGGPVVDVIKRKLFLQKIYISSKRSFITSTIRVRDTFIWRRRLPLQKDVKSFFFSWNGPFAASFSLFSSFQQLTKNYTFCTKSCWWLDSNCEPLVLKVTTLPTEPPQPL